MDGHDGAKRGEVTQEIRLLRGESRELAGVRILERACRGNIRMWCPEPWLDAVPYLHFARVTR